MELKTSFRPLEINSLCWYVPLNQVYLAAGLASLLQVRVTELPSLISPEGLRDTEGTFGASVRENMNMFNISLWDEVEFSQWNIFKWLIVPSSNTTLIVELDFLLHQLVLQTTWRPVTLYISFTLCKWHSKDTEGERESSNPHLL